ncbi:hypothetical protein DPMN_071350 [Dreissena polymorpha]|uniref:Uncharacterized protein n=1 Tax=Dreissena polymorpha TaxID=45954 RepID=A0A9D4BXC1_DREPO|nr:hypothetical protein DPMN_071350 [Dreissena polymorpha]
MFMRSVGLYEDPDCVPALSSYFFLLKAITVDAFGLVLMAGAGLTEETPPVQNGDHQPNSHAAGNGDSNRVALLGSECINHCTNRTASK